MLVYTIRDPWANFKPGSPAMQTAWTIWRGWRLGDGRYKCSACSTRSSVTAGTIFDRTRTPLTTGKDGISALSLKRVLEIGSYQTAWAMLHRLRSVLVRPGRELLSGTVQVADGSGESLHEFVLDHVEPGSTIVTDGWPPYQGLAQLGYVHDRRSQGVARARGDDPVKLLPAVHRVASLAKRWLLGTHHGSVDDAHLVSYLDEFVFRFNRRRSRSRGMVFYRVLELAVAHKPMRYQDLIASRRPKRRHPYRPHGEAIPRV